MTGMRVRVLAAAMVAAVLGAASLANAAPAADIEVIGPQTPWRAYFVQGVKLMREGGNLVVEEGRKTAAFDPAQPQGTARVSPLPAQGWTGTTFDDRAWPRYYADELSDFLDEHGTVVSGRSWPALLCLRTSFGVSDPGQAGDMTVTLRCVGGAVVYINGKEAGRAYMPAGEVLPLTPADAYPTEAYTIDGTAPLPTIGWAAQPDPQYAARYDKRVRTVKVTIAKELLVKGRNVVAVELHRSPVAGPLGGRGGWSHLGLGTVQVSSASGVGVIPYAEAIKGTRLWSAEPLEAVSETPASKSLAKRNWFHALGTARGMPLKGTQVGSPFDPVLPVRMAVPRNGVASAQVVVSDLAGLKGVTANVADLKGPGGAVIPSKAVEIQYAAQHTGVPYCDALMDKAPEGAKTVPVWVIVHTPKDAAPGWYVSSLAVGANGQTFTVPVQVLVTGLTLPESRDFSSQIGINESPETLALQYKVEPYSDAHMQVLEKSFALMGQVGNDVLNVPVILGSFTPIARGWVGAGSAANPDRRAPLVRWIKTDKGLEPEFSLLEKYLDAYSRHCAPPEALCLYMWDAGCAKEMADAYEGRRVASREFTPKSPLLVQVIDPKTGKVSEQEAPAVVDPGAEAFWKPMLEGVRAIVKKRGWSERCIIIGLGGDMRPGSKTSGLLRQWAPYARWDILSHFSGDPGPKEGKMIATGDLEVGLKEFPAAGPMTAEQFETLLKSPLDYMELPTIRWEHQEFSPPMMFRTMPLLRRDLTRLGLDFWMGHMRGYPKNTSWFSHVNALTVAGPDGAIPTVRFEQLREGVQDMEVRLMIMRAYLKLPEEQRAAPRALLNEFPRRVAYGAGYLSGCELEYDWPAYAAKVQQMAAELTGVQSEAAWEKPPQ